MEQIKSRLSIVDVAQSYIKIQKAGVNFKALCPFHSEKSPSFFVSPGRETWHCFGCNRGGDIFSFVMEIEGVDFPEALRILADRAGVELKRDNPEFSSERSKSSRILADSKNFYEEELEKNKQILLYLKNRGLNEETIKSFSIGFVPEGWRNLYNFLKNKNYSDSDIEKTGMTIKSEKGNYDRFRSRIMFPLFNSSGSIVGFSGRVFGDESEAAGGKYINTPQTILYDKSKILYGFDKAKTEIRKKDCCILVEGQMDVIMSHQAGFTNTVAVSGTALTADHLRIIKRLTDKIIVAFDKDEAGFEAVERGIDMALREGFDIKVAVVPLGKDPADTIKENPELWKEAVEKSRHIINFLLEILSEKNEDKRIFKKEVEKKVLPYVAAIGSEIEKAHWVKEIANKLLMKEEPIWEELKKKEFLKDNVIQEPEPKILPRTRKSLLEDRLIGFILWQKNKGEPDLKEEDIKVFISRCQPFLSEERQNFLDNHNLEKCSDLVFEAELFYTGVRSFKDEVNDLILELEKESIKKQLEEIGLKINQLEISNNESEIPVHLNKFQELSKRLNEIRQ
ncbi:MAG: DNA primase [Patescibacteria group bacterium]